MKVLACLTLLCLAGCPDNWEKAEQTATSFAKKIPGATGEVECTHKDTDDDGYCSCTVFMQDGTTQALECGCEPVCIWCTEGCKTIEPFKVQRSGGGGFKDRR